MKTRITNIPTRIPAATPPAQLRTLTLALLLAAFLLPARLLSQTEPSALLELQSTDKGFLLPRMTPAQRDAIASPATGLMIYNTTAGCLDINYGSPAAPVWLPVGCLGTINAFNCAGATPTGSVYAGQLVANVSVGVPYTGGNGGLHTGQVVASTGVTGLTATLAPGNFSNGNGSLSYVISGTATSAGTASFALNIGGQSCTLNLNVNSSQGTITALQCGNASMMGTLWAFQPASGVIAIVPYTGGNGSAHAGQTVTSTGVGGLLATLSPGTFANGNSSLVYAISGMPASAGTASFALSIGGQSCNLNLTVNCGAYVSPGIWKAFMCHNLGAANTAANPFQPSWEINGGYWQWGRKGPDPLAWLNTNTPNFAHGPTGPGAGQANVAAINGWDQTVASNGAWSDASKTPDDPCPAGFRVPTRSQWEGVNANNPQSIVGTWSSSSTNYSSGRFFGSGLMLPAAGNRNNDDGLLFSRGNYGSYWSSSELGAGYAWYLIFGSGGAYTFSSSRRNGRSLRCVAE